MSDESFRAGYACAIEDVCFLMYSVLNHDLGEYTPRSTLESVRATVGLLRGGENNVALLMDCPQSLNALVDGVLRGAKP